MSLVLKSNTSAKKIMGDKYGVVGNTNWSMMLDFASEQYVRNNLPIALSTVLTNERNNEALVFDEGGNPTKISVNVPRLSYNYAQDTKGLVVETKHFAYINPSKNPVTTSQYLPGGVYTLTMEGKGAVNVDSPNITHKYGLGTKDSPIIFRLTPATSVNITYIGEVNYASITTVAGGTGFKSTNKYAELSVGRVSDDIYKVDLASAITSTNWTVLFACRANEVIKEGLNISNVDQSLALLEIGDSSKNITLSRKILRATDGHELNCRLFDVVGKAENNLISIDKDYVVIGVSCSASGFYLSCNGYTTPIMQNMSAFKPTIATLGYSAFNKNSAEATFNKFATYNYALDPDELTELTKNSF